MSRSPTHHLAQYFWFFYPTKTMHTLLSKAPHWCYVAGLHLLVRVDVQFHDYLQAAGHTLHAGLSLEVVLKYVYGGYTKQDERLMQPAPDWLRGRVG